MIQKALLSLQYLIVIIKKINCQLSKISDWYMQIKQFLEPNILSFTPFRHFSYSLPFKLKNTF